MRLVLFTLLFLCIEPSSFGQLNCKSYKNDQGITTKTCFHKNGEPSTVETWDREHREGNLKGFSGLGKELFNYSLRSFAGHSSVYLDYYANGQVKKAEYSSAPDGGIQFWKIIHEFDEIGNQTSYYDLSQPDGHPTIIFTSPNDTITPIKKYEKKQEIVECATPFLTVFTLTNETKKTVRILLKAQVNPYVQLKDTLITLKPKQSLVADSIILANMYLKQTDAYIPEVSVLKGKKSIFKIIQAQPIEGNQRKTYSWHIIRQ